MHNSKSAARSKRLTRDEIIAANPILEYCERRGWKMRPVGAEWVCFCPFHDDRRKPNFYVNERKQLWTCRAGCGGGSVIDLHAKLHNLNVGEAMAALSVDLLDMPLPPPKPAAKPEDPFGDKEKAAARADWPRFERPTDKEMAIVAKLRGLSPEGVALAAERGLLFCADYYREGRAWVVTDSRGINAQARRLDGEKIDGKKAKNLLGSVASWPVGLREAQAFEKIALVEGGPDLLAAFHLAWCAGQEERVAAVAILGSHDLPSQSLPLFAGKRVRIFAHHDKSEAGFGAENRWWEQLNKAGAIVDGYSFKGLTTSGGEPVKDVCDFAHVDVDLWEREREDVEEAFFIS